MQGRNSVKNIEGLIRDWEEYLPSSSFLPLSIKSMDQKEKSETQTCDFPTLFVKQNIKL